MLMPRPRQSTITIGHRCCCWLALCLAAVVATAATAQSDEDELIERILALRRQAAALIEQLGPQGRAELERRLAAGEPPPAPEESRTASADDSATLRAASETNAQRCPLLAFFDSDGDGRVTALDRFWRYLHLWRDGNGDGAATSAEMEQLFDLGIRSIEASGSSFEGEHGGGDLRRGVRLVFYPVGKGGEAVLSVDASRLRRGHGPSLADAEGHVLDGLQPLSDGQVLRLASGETLPLNCR